MKIHFLGTNGWYDSDTGNTISALIDSKEAYIILDAGFGIAKAGDYIVEDKPVFLFLSHFHIDHICGLHTLTKMQLKQPLTIISHKGLKKMMKTIWDHPYAASLTELGYKVNLIEVKAGKYNLPVKFDCLPLQHIDEDFGYRFYLEDKIITYCTDTHPCANDVKLAEKADVLIHESGYWKEQLGDFWGHSDPEGAAKVAKDAGAKKMYLTQFGPNSFNTRAKRLDAQKRARKIFKNSFAAFDGVTVKL
ncbi:MAG: ribonuclease Z [Candidatus Magasanikbacteria bacterium]|nr:ribonuclease Z [Candidatus Magasanikbacteria bacterium]